MMTSLSKFFSVGFAILICTLSRTIGVSQLTLLFPGMISFFIFLLVWFWVCDSDCLRFKIKCISCESHSPDNFLIDIVLFYFLKWNKNNFKA